MRDRVPREGATTVFGTKPLGVVRGVRMNLDWYITSGSFKGQELKPTWGLVTSVGGVGTGVSVQSRERVRGLR